MESGLPVVMHVESPPALRSTILGSFLRGRPRGVSTSHPPAPSQRDSPSPPASPTPPSTSHSTHSHRRRSFAPAGLINTQLAANGNPQATPVVTSLGISSILRRRRSTGQHSTNQTPSPPAPVVQPVAAPSSPPPTATSPAMPLAAPPQVNRGLSSTSSSPNQTHRIRLVPHLDSRRTLRFEPITRDLRDDDPPLRIGRFTDRSGIGFNAANLLSSNKLAFKSKVVSRSHAEIWLESGKFFIRDTKSSSGTFLNHLRLSPAGHESRPYQLRDGDVLQLGVDYQGGSEDIYKSVKIKVEVGREWQAGANAFKCVSEYPHHHHLFFLPLDQYARHQPTQGTCCDHRSEQTGSLQGQTTSAQGQYSRLLHLCVSLFFFFYRIRRPHHNPQVSFLSQFVKPSSSHLVHTLSTINVYAHCSRSTLRPFLALSAAVLQTSTKTSR